MAFVANGPARPCFSLRDRFAGEQAKEHRQSILPTDRFDASGNSSIDVSIVCRLSANHSPQTDHGSKPTGRRQLVSRQWQLEGTRHPGNFDLTAIDSGLLKGGNSSLK
jgi:hypothetical protein